MPLIPSLGWQRQVELDEFEASFTYRQNSRTGFKVTDKPCLIKTKSKPVVCMGTGTIPLK